ncbi:MAG: hypothetical protein JKY88_06220 [Pseudomonadales bacterium]|nr:hypothetical protein [Pseudomonadales bacterium]
MSRVTLQQKQIWSDHVKHQPSSNLTQQVYCDKYKINFRQFGYWKRVFRSKSNLPPKPRSTLANRFVPVQLAAQASPLPLTVTLSNGISISGIDEGNLQLISPLLGACQ